MNTLDPSQGASMIRREETRRQFLKATGGALVTAGAASALAGPDREADTPRAIPRRVLGRTNLSVSLLGFGVGDFIDPAVYRCAVDLGINYFHLSFDRHSVQLQPPDKFNMQALAALRPMRRRIVVSYMPTVRTSKPELLADLDDFLRQSEFGHVDVWFVCCPSPELLDEFADALTHAKAAGKARWGALSTHSLARDMPKLAAEDSPVDVVMMGYNFASSKDDKKHLATLHAAGRGITPMKPLAGRFYKDVVDTPGPLLRWLANDARVHSIPVAMKKLSHVRQNVIALQQPLSPRDRQTLEAMLAHTSPRFCRLCGACQGQCPRGLAVSDLVRSAMYADGYENRRMARSRFHSIPAAQRNIPCKDCSGCSVQCPNGVAIRGRLLRAQQLFT